ncbi:MAG: alpha/beta fold hydrolase, partial [Nitrososphaeraceae archaeon]
IDKSVDFIRKITKSDKISLFGYCWGGDLALMYSALHPEKVKNLVLLLHREILILIIHYSLFGQEL